MKNLHTSLAAWLRRAWFPILLVLLLAQLVVQGCSHDPVRPGDRVQGDGIVPAEAVEGMTTSGSADLGVERLSAAEQAEYCASVQAEEGSLKILAARTLSVMFGPQVPPGSWSLTMSCGPASLNMACAYLWNAVLNQVVYIRRINQFLGKSDIDNCLPGGSSTSDLERAGRAVNNCPNTYRASGWTLQRIRQEIDAGRPVVVAVWAGRLPNRGYGYAGGHFVLVVGYN
ncbi:MAG: hypothetical protein FJ280_26620, partial [Planctomycetes bacterium]|nr:hypothetical protein [Planctomycetota bacterium]